MNYWEFFIEICVKTYSVISFIGEKCNQLPNNISFKKYLKINNALSFSNLLEEY